MPKSGVKQIFSDVSEDFSIGVVRGDFPAFSSIHKFGLNPSVSTTDEDIWAGGGSYSGFITAAAAVRIKAGGNANDTAAGSGARSITIIGLDENFNDASETVVTAGASASAATTTTFIRVFRAYVEACGTYTANNTGDITIETTGGVVMAIILATYGQTQLAIYTIPASFTGYLVRMSCDVDRAQGGAVNLWQRQSADDSTAPMKAKRLVSRRVGVTGPSETIFSVPIALPAKTDFWASGASATGTTVIAVEFNIILARNTT